MKHFTKHSKYLIVALASMLIVSGVLAQVTIPTGLTNAIQYIMETIWTDDGTSSGTINVHIDPNYFFIRTGFLADGTGWNNKALGLDGSGNVVYVNANAVNTPFFNLAGNYIPKINQTGDELELSTMFQSTLGDISVGHINPLAKMHIQGNFRVDTISGSLMQYTYTTGSTQVIGAVTPPDPSQLCDCDTSPNSLDCPAVSFTTGVQQGNGQGFCVDITSSGGGLRSYWVYLESTTNINQGAFIVTGNRAGVMTLNPQATLHVNGDVMIANIPAATLPAAQVLVPGPNGEVQYAPFPAGSAGEINTASNLGAGAAVFSNKVGVDLRFRTLLGQGLTSITQQTNTVTINTPAQTLSLAGNTLSISSGNSVTLPAATSANAWNLTGNGGTNPANNFVGTTDPVSLDFRTNNIQIGRLFATNGSVQRGHNQAIASSNNATIAGGINNQIQNGANTSTIGGGASNIIQFSGSTIGGGLNNLISSVGSTIGGGIANHASGTTSTIAGGISNIAREDGFVGGGSSNQANGYRSAIAGGFNNITAGQNSVIVGGLSNSGVGEQGFIGGGWINYIGGINNSIVGGSSNRIPFGFNNAIGGGANNQIAGSNNITSTIAGGTNNTINATSATIGGGEENTANGLYATIGGGNLNTANNQRSTIGGGGQNNSNAIGSTVGGGYSNSATGAYSTVPGGSQNSARGSNSFAAGQSAIASGNNSFVWSDGAPGGNSYANNEFMVNAERVIIGRITNADAGLLNTYLTTPGPHVFFTSPVRADAIGANQIVGDVVIGLNSITSLGTMMSVGQLTAQSSIKTNGIYRRIHTINSAQTYNITATDHIIILNAGLVNIQLGVCNSTESGREITVANKQLLNGTINGNVINGNKTETHICNGLSRTKLFESVNN